MSGSVEQATDKAAESKILAPPFGRLAGVRKVFERRDDEPLVAIEDVSFDVAGGPVGLPAWPQRLRHD